MIDGSIGYKIETKQRLNPNDGHKYLPYARSVVEKFLLSRGVEDTSQIQSITLPTSSDQPEEVPLVLIQAENIQLVINQRGATLLYNLTESTSYMEAAKMSTSLLKGFFDSSNGDPLIDRGDIRLVETHFNNFIKMDSFSESIEYLVNKRVIDSSIEIDQGGYALRYSSPSNVKWFDHFREEFSTNAKSEEKLFATLVSCAFVLGGYSFENLDFQLLKEEHVEGFLDNYKEINVAEKLQEFYEEQRQQ